MTITILERVTEFNSKNVADYSTMELIEWYVYLKQLYVELRASGADIDELFINALKNATKELKRRCSKYER